MFSAGGAAIQAKPQIIENQKCDRHTHKHTQLIHTHTHAKVLRLPVLVLNFVHCAGADCTLPSPTLSYLPPLLPLLLRRLLLH